MAKAQLKVIQALRGTAAKLSSSGNYQWGHMGSCNCGYLGQEITKLDKAEIHRRALQRYGDWNEQLNDYCPASGLPFDDVISEMIAFGFDIDDLRHLEHLSDPTILKAIPHRNNLRHNVKDDVVLYLTTWADLLEQEILNRIQLPADAGLRPEPVH